MSDAEPENRDASLTSAERRVLAAATGIVSLRMLGLFMLLPVLAVYAAGLPGATPLLIGLAVGVYGLTQAALQIPFGWVSDRIGRRPVVAVGLVLFGLGSLAAAVAASAWQLVAARALQGAGAVSGALTAAVADGTRTVARTRSLAIIGISIGAAFVVSLVLGPALAAWVGVPGVFLIIAVAAALALPIAFLGLPGGRPEVQTGTRGRRLDPVLLACYTGVLLLHLMLTAIFVKVPVELEALGFAVAGHWKLYLVVLGLSLPGTVGLILLVERRPKLTVALAMGLPGLAGLVLLAAPPDRVWTGLALILFFSGFNLLEARFPTVVSLRAPGPARGAALGRFATAQFAGAFLGGLLGGPLAASSQGVPLLILLAAVAMSLVWSVAHRMSSDPIPG